MPLPLLAAPLLLLAQASAPALQPVWGQFEKIKLPAPTQGEDATVLEDLLASLRRTELGCRARLADAEGSKARLAAWKKERTGNGLEIGTLELDGRLRALTKAEPAIEQLGADGHHFRLHVEQKGANSTPDGLARIGEGVPSLVWEKLEITDRGWEAVGTFETFDPWIATPLLSQPVNAPAGGRRSSELRLRISAVRPGIEQCLAELGRLGLEQYAWFESTRARYARLPHGGPLQPFFALFDGASLAARPDRLVVDQASPDLVRVRVQPAGAAAELRRTLGPFIGRQLVGERAEGDELTLTFLAGRALEAVAADQNPQENQALAAFVAILREVADPKWQEVLADDAGLAEASAALQKSAADHWPMLVELETFESRRALLRARVEAQGIGISAKEAGARVAGCGAEVEGAIGGADGVPHPIQLKGARNDEGPHQLACLRDALRSLEITRYEANTKSWKATGTLVLEQPKVPKGETAALPPAPPAIPIATTRLPAGASLRVKLTELAAAIVSARERLGATPIRETQILAANDARLSALEAAARTGDRLAAVLFADMARLPLWMDFTARAGGTVDLNLAPREKGEGLLRELRAGKCPTTKAKTVGDSIRATVACVSPASAAPASGGKAKAGK